MRRMILALAGLSLLLLLAASPVAHAQDGPELNVQCVSIVGEPPDGGWDEFSLQDAIASGAAELTAVSAGSDCRVSGEGAACMTVTGSAPVTGWERDSLTEAIGSGRTQIVLLAAAEECAQVIAETVDPVGVPDPLELEVVDSGVVIGDLSSSFVAIVRNPNTDTWAAQGMPMAVSVLDAGGQEIEATSTFATLLPGQTGAVIGFLTTTGAPDRVDLVFEGADFNWLPTERSVDSLRVTGVKTKSDPATGFVTTGKIRNHGDAVAESVSVHVIHRNKAGDIIGAEFTLIDAIPAGGRVAFEVPNLSGVGRNKVAATEVYYQLSSVL